MQRHPQTGLVPAGAPLGGGACGSSLRSSSSAPLLCMLLTARLTGQRCSTLSGAGCIKTVASPSALPSHFGQSSSSRITGMRSWSALMVVFAAAVSMAKVCIQGQRMKIP